MDRFMSFFMPVYIIFTVVCFGTGCLYPEQRIAAFQLWYRTTAFIWLIFAVAAVVPLIKLCKLNKLRNEIKRRKE